MKFKELSIDKLKSEFKEILDNYTDDELFDTIKPYIIKEEDINNDKSNET